MGFQKIILTSLFFYFQQSNAVDCFSLNLKNRSFTNPDRTISLAAKTDVYLQEGNFATIDENGTDGRAIFALPKPDPMNVGIPIYQAQIRLLGKPGTTVKFQSCLIHSVGGLFCNQHLRTLTRETGASNFIEINKEALYIYDYIYGSGLLDRVPIVNFWEHTYFWKIETSEKAHVQMRFCR